MAPALLGLPDEVLRGIVGSDDLSGLYALRDAVAANPNPSADPVCLKRCGLA